MDHLGELRAICTEIAANGDRITDAGSPAPRSAATGLNTSVWTGDRDRFRAGSTRSRRSATPSHPSSGGSCSPRSAGFELRWGSLETAESLSAELLDRATETGEPDALLWYVNLMGYTYRQAGRYDDALGLFAPLMETDTPVTAIGGIIAAMVLCEAERHDEARPIAERFFPWGRGLPRDPSFLPNLGPLAITAAELGDRDEASWLLEQLEPLTAYWSAWSAAGADRTGHDPRRSAPGDAGGPGRRRRGVRRGGRPLPVDRRASSSLPTHCCTRGLARRDAGASGDAVVAPIAEAFDLAAAGATRRSGAERSGPWPASRPGGFVVARPRRRDAIRPPGHGPASRARLVR